MGGELDVRPANGTCLIDGRPATTVQRGARTRRQARPHAGASGAAGVSCAASTVIETKRKSGCPGELSLELRERKALRRARLPALHIDEVRDPDEAAQVVACDPPARPLGQGELGHDAVVVELFERNGARPPDRDSDPRRERGTRGRSRARRYGRVVASTTRYAAIAVRLPASRRAVEETGRKSISPSPGSAFGSGGGASGGGR